MLRHVAVVAAALSVLLCGTAADGGAWQSHDVYVDEHGRAWALQDLCGPLHFDGEDQRSAVASNHGRWRYTIDICNEVVPPTHCNLSASAPAQPGRTCALRLEDYAYSPKCEQLGSGSTAGTSAGCCSVSVLGPDSLLLTYSYAERSLAVRIGCGHPSLEEQGTLGLVRGAGDHMNLSLSSAALCVDRQRQLLGDGDEANLQQRVLALLAGGMTLLIVCGVGCLGLLYRTRRHGGSVGYNRLATSVTDEELSDMDGDAIM